MNLYYSREKVLFSIHAIWCVCVCVLQSQSHQLKEQEDCYTEAKGYISACPVSQTSSEWPSAAPPSSPYLQKRKKSQNE